VTKQKVIIIGAGLAGSLLAIYLAKRGIETDVYEARGDMRREEMSAGRSINLALSDRGIAALREVGMDEYMLREAIPMFGRMVHAVDGQTKLLPYSGRKGEYINSISRAGLNAALINEAEKYAGVRFFFGERCVDFDCASGEAKFETGKIAAGGTLIATDGAGSAVRNAMLHSVPDFNYSESWLEHGYKELHIPPAGGDGFLMEKNALHIWARHSFMMIALPNFDGSFTCTLFLAHKGENSFESIVDRRFRGSDVSTRSGSEGLKLNAQETLATASGTDRLRKFFQTNFADAIPLMPTLMQDFFANPIGNLGTIKCFPWNVEGRALLLGDSAHAIVPFYGQGMNCAFEDCRVLDSLIEKHGTDWKTIYEEYGALRKENTDAIADMAEENFYEMRDAVADPVFQRKRALETRLEQTFPDYFSKYSMVTFREDLPYVVAKRKGNAQDNLLMKLCTEVENVSELNLDEVMEKVRSLKVEL
jgi:kynurenine 3-monooxygenase